MLQLTPARWEGRGLLGCILDEPTLRAPTPWSPHFWVHHCYSPRAPSDLVSSGYYISLPQTHKIHFLREKYLYGLAFPKHCSYSLWSLQHLSPRPPRLASSHFGSEVSVLGGPKEGGLDQPSDGPLCWHFEVNSACSKADPHFHVGLNFSEINNPSHASRVDFQQDGPQHRETCQTPSWRFDRGFFLEKGTEIGRERDIWEGKIGKEVSSVEGTGKGEARLLF